VRAAALLALAALAGSCGAEKSPDEVRVFAASSLTEVMQTIAADFEKETGVKVRLNLASSSTLAKQIVEGAPCDVFLSADEEWADFVEKAGCVEPGTRRDLLTNDLTIVFPPKREPLPVLGLSTRDLEEDPESHRRSWVRAQLTHHSVRRIAMGDPSHVPAGKYARRAFEEWGLWKDLEGRIVPCDTVRAALALVERGEADAGIVYVTDATATRAVDWGFSSRLWLLDGVRWNKFATEGVVLLPERVPRPSNPIRYPALRVRASGAKAARFDKYLDSLAARKVFEEAGFGIARAGD